MGKCLVLACCFLALMLTGCGVQSPSLDGQSRDQKLTELRRQRENALYELKLRQDEVDQMEATAKRPGVVGVSNEWLKRRDKLREEMIQLKVKVHDLDSEIADLSASTGKR